MEDELKKAIKDLLEVIDHIGISEGYCCCGSPADGHNTYYDGHAYVDIGDYHFGPIVDAARKLVT